MLADLPAANLAANFALTVLTSSFVSSAIFYWLTSRKERHQFLRGKLEELFMAYQAYCKLVFTIRYVPYRDVMTGKLVYNQALDLVMDANQKDTPRHHEVCEMVIRLYFDEFLPAWDELAKRRQNLNRVHAEFKRSYQEGEDTERLSGLTERFLRATVRSPLARARPIDRSIDRDDIGWCGLEQPAEVGCDALSTSA